MGTAWPAILAFVLIAVVAHLMTMLVFGAGGWRARQALKRSPHPLSAGGEWEAVVSRPRSLVLVPDSSGRLVLGGGSLTYYRARSVHPTWTVPVRDVAVQRLGDHPITTVTNVVVWSSATDAFVVAVAHHRMNRALGTLSGSTWARALTADGADELVDAVVAGGGEAFPATIDHRPLRSTLLR